MQKGGSPELLGKGNIGKILLSYSIPAIIAQTAASLYNIIDSIFIGYGVNKEALTGVGICLPLMNLATAFGAMVGAGGSILISIKLGQQDTKAANHILGNIVALNVILGLLITAVGLIFMDPILNLFGASPVTIPYARDFMRIILIGNVFTHMYFGLCSAARAAGFPQKAMTATLITVGVNVALAPIFIFVLGRGVAGAASATVLAQMTALIILLIHFIDKQKQLHIIKKNLIPVIKTVKSIMAIGLSSFMLHICSCLVVIIINNQLKKYGGDLAIGAHANINKVLMFFAMLVLGFNQGMQTIAGYNFGAKLYNRVNEMFKKTVIYASIIMMTAFVCCELFAETICTWFTPDKDFIKMTAHGMRIAVAAFPVIGFSMVTSNYFQSINKAAIAAFLSTTRQMLLLTPILFILPPHFGLDGVWLCMPVSDFTATVLAAFFLIRQYKKFKQITDNNITQVKNG